MHHSPNRWFSLLRPLVALILVLFGVACQEPSKAHTLDVFAASSLTEAFADLGQAFEAAHPDTDVRLNFAGSQILRLQIDQGADADVFASANHSHMQALIDSGRVVDSHIFTHNELVVIVPRSNPAQIHRFDDLLRARRLVIGNKNVPAGRYARQVLGRTAAVGPDFEARALSRVVSEESNVRLVRAKVELGEADAAIVYRSDAVASERVKTVPIPAGINVRADYPMARVDGSGDREQVERWFAFVSSPEGQAILARHGFGVDR